MYQGTSSLQQQTLQHLRYCGIVCCHQNMRVFHASISKIGISKNPMMDCKYMWIPRHLVSQEFIDKCGLERNIYKGCLYCEIQKGIDGFPQAGKLVNTYLKERLATCGYIECIHTTGLWWHIFCLVQFRLVGDNFGVIFSVLRNFSI